MSESEKPRLGVSACLLGEPVRFDGGHKRCRFLLEDCQPFFEFHAMCPEAELGLGIPRPVIQLRRFDADTRLVFSKQRSRDLTDDMADYAAARIQQLPVLDGFVFKKDSPSCGPFRVPVYDDRTGMRERDGVGLFARAFMAAHPDVPVEDEGRLNDKAIRENFLERVYAHYRWRHIADADTNLAAFQAYHRDYKLMLMAKSNSGAKQLGRLVATANRDNLARVRRTYFRQFMALMANRPSPGQHVNVLMHMMGYLKHRLDHHDKVELLNWFESYRQQQVDRVTPLVLLQHHFRRHPHEYIAGQYYFEPYPLQLMQPV
jgi:uncharacterized protein YbgA (DUF1722 family)/uncharacterized protein YbbK (DUF523 family)